MYSSFQLAKTYLNYYYNSKNGKGHGVHSPFVFDFIIHVLNDKKKYDCYDKIEAIRKSLLRNNGEISVKDFGAGSASLHCKTRKIKDIAHTSLKKKKYAQLLFRIAKYYAPETIVELGTSFGISTCYFASAHNNSNVFTLEGSPCIAGIANNNFRKAGLNQIELIEGEFGKSIPAVLSKIENVELLFIDGNHKKKPTLEYFEIFLKKTTQQSIFIFDDIHWSHEMEEAWKLIKLHPAVTLSIDLFFIGLVFFSNDFKVKQDFTIRF